jgi:hypothetical protein
MLLFESSPLSINTVYIIITATIVLCLGKSRAKQRNPYNRSTLLVPSIQLLYRQSQGCEKSDDRRFPIPPLSLKIPPPSAAGSVHAALRKLTTTGRDVDDIPLGAPDGERASFLILGNTGLHEADDSVLKCILRLLEGSGLDWVIEGVCQVLDVYTGRDSELIWRKG